MAPAASDRNLLFGILALQMDFITRDALVAAMNAWVLQKHRSLADLLEERGALRRPTARCWSPWCGGTSSSTAATRPGAWPRSARPSAIVPNWPRWLTPDPDVQASLACSPRIPSRQAERPFTGLAGHHFSPDHWRRSSSACPPRRVTRFRILRPTPAAGWARSSSPATRS